MLALEVDLVDRPPEPKDKAVIGIIDLAEERHFEPVAETSAWNFHQGSRQQWVPGRPDEFIYNDRDDHGFISVVVGINSGKRTELPCPIYAVDPSGTYGLGVNFARLQRLGGYGYRGSVDPYSDDPIPGEDGIYRVDLATGEYKLIISIAEVADLGGFLGVSKNQHHFLTHLLFNPDGSRICFAHKYWLKDGGAAVRLITVNPDGTGLYALPGEVTHFCWRGPSQILAWGRHRPFMMKVRHKNVFTAPVLQPLLGLARKTRSRLRQHLLGDRYLLLTDRTQDVKSVGVGVFAEDGHPSFSPDRSWMITDTYGDKNHFRRLILYDWENGRRMDIGRFYSLPDGSLHVGNNWDNSEMRSDLHPRWNRAGTQVCIDSVHEGTRQMYVVDVSGIVQSKG